MAFIKFCSWLNKRMTNNSEIIVGGTGIPFLTSNSLVWEHISHLKEKNQRRIWAFQEWKDGTVLADFYFLREAFSCWLVQSIPMFRLNYVSLLNLLHNNIYYYFNLLIFTSVIFSHPYDSLYFLLLNSFPLYAGLTLFFNLNCIYEKTHAMLH